jgi:hypothetical protein
LYQIAQDPPSDDFKAAWVSAGRYIQNQAGSGLSWLRADLRPPLAEHLSFRIGNQIFFIFIEAAEVEYRNGVELFLKVCSEANAVPCRMPMEKRFGDWGPKLNGWGLINTIDNAQFNPLDLVSDALIEMSDWEVHDFAIQIVAEDIVKNGGEIFGRQPSPEIDPSIWFKDKQGSHFVVVRFERHPTQSSPVPKNIESIKQHCSKFTSSGFFASVVLANSEDPFDPDAAKNGNYSRLYRGHGLMPKYPGLRRI